MNQMQQIAIQLDGIATVLKNKKFSVPAYQRSYAWKDEHVDALLDDIEDAIKNNENEYFLGSIVIAGASNSRHEVVDGQQRLTTASLLISAIKEIFKESEDTEAALSIQTDFLSKTDRRTKEQESRLTLNEIDNEPFQELITDSSTIIKKNYQKPSHKLLLAAFKRIKERLQKIGQKSKDSEIEFHKWLDFLENNTKVIVVTTPDDSNAFIIFETLNDRGLELAISDLLKNYLFHKSGGKINETKNRWLTMTSILESASEDPIIVTYLRHFSMSKYGLIREKELFSTIKQKITSQKGALSFSSQLAEKAKIYSALINTEHEYLDDFDSSVKDAIQTINLLGMIQIRPLLLAILEKFTNQNIKRDFSLLVSVAVRLQIAGKTGSGALERMYSDAAKSVSDEKIADIKQLMESLRDVPSDTEFEAAFSIATISKANIARYYLRTIEEKLDQTSQELTPNKNATKVNLEHVLPLTAGIEWDKHFHKDEIRAYSKRLGNLAIMSSDENSKIGNSDFQEKAKAYRKSSFQLTKMIGSKKIWDTKAIEERQSEMAKTAVLAWPIK